MVLKERPFNFFVTYGNCHVHYAVVFICLGWIFVSMSEFLRSFDTSLYQNWYHFPVFTILYILAYVGNRKLIRWLYIPCMVLNAIALMVNAGQALVHFMVLTLELIEQFSEKSMLQFVTEDRSDEIKFTMEGTRYVLIIMVLVYSLRVLYRDYLYLKDVVGNPNTNIAAIVDL
ncbi:unnamed protein product [Bursaphelenchus okinawaensis]|uniref:Uncharacterized protein n=1 Tax=Bursaphelenchus okinawaensis TaxID=465554 RepID=A0A811LJZ4_9BILA|nr:unnamed protein product [Bursaphelenchus okinawaensis]CAG9123869.1 unnamed protein product [Bursaphelenchus okinawaensis]